MSYAIAILLCLSGICYMLIGSFVLKDDAKAALRRTYFGSVVAATIWCISYAMMTVASSAEAARLLWSVGLVSNCLFFVLWSHFLSYLTSYRTSFVKAYIGVLYAGALVLSFLVIFSNETVLTNTDFGYQFSYAATPVYLALLFLVLIAVVLMLFLKIKWVQQAKVARQKKAAVFFMLFTIFVAAPAIVLDYLIPIFFDFTVVPLAVFLILIVSLVMFYILKKYRILDLTVRNVSEEIFSLSEQPILVLNYENRVIITNMKAEKFWARKLTGLNADELILVNEKKPEQSFFNESAIHSIKVGIGSGIRNCNMHLSVLRDKYGDIIHKVVVIEDVTTLLESLTKAENANKENSALLAEISHEKASLAQARELSENANKYQQLEANNIIKGLNDGVAQGFLAFNYQLQPHGEDTAQAAAAYKLIGDTMRHAVAFINGYVDEISFILQEFSNENFDVTIRQNYMGDFVAIKQSMERLILSISTLISEIQSTTSQVENGAEQISQSTQELMSRFEEQTAVMTDVKDAVATLAEKTQKNATDAQSANELSGQVQEAANTGSRHMQDMTAVMDAIKSSSSEIAEVVSIIEGIAFQTNLLALNASVEAARAGEHGRGFSVVAEEVRNLARRSSEAAKSTSDMITTSLNRVDEGVAKSAETSEALQKIVDITAAVTDVISTIAYVSNEQAGEFGEIQNNMEELYRVTSDNTSSVKNNASISEELSCQASTLMSLVDRFKISEKQNK